jgi:hypothetical protein
MDLRWRIFVLSSMEISVICIATRGPLRLIIVISASRFLAKISPHKICIVNYLDTVWLGGVAENCYRHGAVMFDSISLCLKHGNKKRKQAVHMMMSGCAHLWIKLFITGIGIQPFLPGSKDSGGTIWYLVTKYRKNVESRFAPSWRIRISANGLRLHEHTVLGLIFLKRSQDSWSVSRILDHCF